MLEPQDRRHLLGLLRPPEGYDLHCAIGTTYTLDLLALLMVPLAFTLYEPESDLRQGPRDPLALLSAIRRYSDRISVFCEAGRIAVPKKYEPMFGYLESSIFEASAANPYGSFHPKVWVVRYMAPEDRVSYRLLCLTRNLTFDRSWDTSLVLEGGAPDPSTDYKSNDPLCEFLISLLDRARGPVPERVVEHIDLMQTELQHVKFDLPPGFTGVQFWPLGHARQNSSPLAGPSDRTLAVSPFLSPTRLSALSSKHGNNVLISRQDSLAQLPVLGVPGFQQYYTFDPQVEEPEDESSEDDSPAPTADEDADKHRVGETSHMQSTLEDIELSGLHAKLYIVEQGSESHIWTGSANATESAFSRNVEFLVELVGNKSLCGIDALLARHDGQISFIDLLSEVLPSEVHEPADQAQKDLEDLLRTSQRTLATSGLFGHITPSAKDQMLRFELRSNDAGMVTLRPEVHAKCWLASNKNQRMPLANGPVVAVFDPILYEELTSLVAFEVEANRGGRKATSSFVINVQLVGAPSDRKERLLSATVGDTAGFLRLVFMLLATGNWDNPDAWALHSGSGALSATVAIGLSGGPTLPLFESLLRALDRSPEHLEDINRVVLDLKNSPTGEQVLPKDFTEIWEPIWQVYVSTRQEKSS